MIEVDRYIRLVCNPEHALEALPRRRWIAALISPLVVSRFKFVSKRETTKDEVNAAIQRAAGQELKGILGVTDQPNVSIDFNHDSRSSIFHLDQTKVLDGTLVRVLSWYDNEWGFSNRMADTAVAMGKLI